jgi:tRNA threonylcarbamoyladenosine biosynthesis protein TsaB
MNLLAIDTAANLCAACVLDTASGRELARCVRDIGTGHAEQLMRVIGEALQAAGIDYSGLGGIAVATGPGSFTGVRVGVSTARGLALALKIPATGVTTLEALAAETRASFPDRPVMVAIDARREEIYAAGYDGDGKVLYHPAVVNLLEAVMFAKELVPVLAGSAAKIVADRSGESFEIASLGATADIGVYARHAVTKGFGDEKPKPVYLREPDAKPQAALPRSAG